MSEKLHLTEQLSEYVAGTNADRLPALVVERAESHIPRYHRRHRLGIFAQAGPAHHRLRACARRREYSPR
jgi:hypothetical protein